MALFWPWHLFESYSKNVPSPGHSNLVSDEVYICSSLLLMVSWWLPYLAKGPMSDFNNGLGNDSNSGCILALQRLIKSDLNNGPSPSQSFVRWSIHLFRSPTYGFLVGAISPKGCRPDFNNDLGGDSNSGPVLGP